MFQILLLGLCWILSKAEDCDYETDNYCLIEDTSATGSSLDSCGYEAGIFETMDDWDELLAGLGSWDGEFYIGLFYAENDTFVWANDVEGDENEVPDDVNIDELSYSSENSSCVLLVVNPDSANNTFSLVPSDCDSMSDGYICTKMMDGDSTTGMPTQSPVTSSPTQSPVTSSPTQSPVTSSPTQSPVTSSPTKNPTYTPPTKNPTYTPPTKNPTYTPPTQSPVTPSPTQSPVPADEELTFEGTLDLGLADYSGEGDPCDDDEVITAVSQSMAKSYQSDSGLDVDIEVTDCSSQETSRRRLLQTSYEINVDFKVKAQSVEDFLEIAVTSISKSELETAFSEVISELGYDLEITVESVTVENCKNSNNKNCDSAGAAELSYFMSMLIILFGFYFW